MGMLPKIKKRIERYIDIRVAIALGMVLCLGFAGVAHATFLRSSGSGFGYGYGSGDSGYGYGYGYATGGDSAYGFEGTDGVATAVSVLRTDTVMTVSYTTDYTATNHIKYGTSESTMTSVTSDTIEAAGTHSTAISGLTCGTTYYFATVTEDAGGTEWTSATQSITMRLCGSSGTTTTGGGGSGSGNSAITTPVVIVPIVTVTPTTTVTDDSAEAALPGVGEVTITEDPSDATVLAEAMGVSQDTGRETLVAGQVQADAKAFGLTLAPAQATEITNFIVYGISPATAKLGQGERRALIRDYMDTMQRSGVVWSDIERMANGRIPIQRNLEAERAQVATVLPIFRKIFGHDPNFDSAVENLSWNTLMYRIRFPRDLVREMSGIQEYLVLYWRTPSTPLQWSIVRVLGYIK
jgi:hypothetical protein